MKIALEQAKFALALNEVPVGAVIVKNGEVIATGYNRRETDKNALLHAEMVAINAACAVLGGWRLWECEMYVTLEPCPMCAGAIINSRIRRVVYGACDQKEGCCESVVDLFALPFNHTPIIVKGVCEDESNKMLKEFFEY
ncbi:MAG: nucleoside deaminase, partial [Oscillospiraceae bacterium]